MYMINRPQAGFTLIELVIFMIVVSIGVVGILSVMNTVVKSSADPMVRKQAAALADSILEEILLKPYQDPDGLPNIVESGRDTYDDVDDYNGLNQTTFTDLPVTLSAYVIGIVVAAPAAVNGITMKKIVVTVTGGSEVISMTGYRANY